MSFQWTFIAAFLYLEIGIVTILMLPIASPRKWHSFFKSRLFAIFQHHTAVYFYVFLGILSLFLIDAIKEIRKYSHSGDTTHVHLTNEMKTHVKLFRAQRNFYITGFAIFLTFVIRRLVTMIIIQSELLDKSEKIIKEAEAAKDLAKTTVLAHTMQHTDLEYIENIKKDLEAKDDLLREAKIKKKELQEEVTMWKVKYEEVIANISGKGDQ